MQDNDSSALRIELGGVSAQLWDDATVDSDIGIPADAFSFEVFNSAGNLPASVTAGTAAKVYVGDVLVMTGIVDAAPSSISRDGSSFRLSGRDLAGQLIDCSAPIDHAQNLTLSQIVTRYINRGDLASLKIKTNVAQDHLKARTGVEPAQSIWDVLNGAAESAGQYVWFSADGTLTVGNPFSASQPAAAPLLYLNRKDSNVLAASYDEDVSSVYSEVKVYGQTEAGKNFSASVSDSRLAAVNLTRRHIAHESRADNQHEASAYAQKLMRDQWLNAVTLTLTLDRFLHAGEPWQTGVQLRFDSDIEPRATGDWVVYGRTFNLSRARGQTTELRCKRKADWMQPVKHNELIRG